MKLKLELGNSIHIFPDNKGKFLVVPDNVTMQDIVEENQILERDINVWKTKSTNINKTTDRTSSHIRFAIRKDMKPTPWPYHPFDVHKECFKVLDHVFFVGLLTGETSVHDKGSRC